MTELRRKEIEMYQDAIKEALLNLKGIMSEVDLITSILERRLNEIPERLSSNETDFPVH